MDNDIHITYCLTAPLDETAVRSAVDLLSPEERARHDHLIFARDRRDFAVAHALLRRALSARSDRAPHEWTFTSNPLGKPQLPTGVTGRTGLSFNLAHTDGLVACAVGQGAELGIDVETLDRRADDGLTLAERLFSQAEIVDLKSHEVSERHLRFIEIWTLKEAYVKARGDGLSLPLNNFAFVYDGPSRLRFDVSNLLPHVPWHFALFAPSDRHRMAIAVTSHSLQAPRLVVYHDVPNGLRSRDTMVAIRTSALPNSLC
jgi:4'-phosphopantetheinyl transferase